MSSKDKKHIITERVYKDVDTYIELHLRKREIDDKMEFLKGVLRDIGIANKKDETISSVEIVSDTGQVLSVTFPSVSYKEIKKEVYDVLCNKFDEEGLEKIKSIFEENFTFKVDVKNYKNYLNFVEENEDVEDVVSDCISEKSSTPKVNIVSLKID